jgi:hypothetical protein
MKQLMLTHGEAHIELPVAFQFVLRSSHDFAVVAERMRPEVSGAPPPLTERFCLGKTHLATLSANIRIHLGGLHAATLQKQIASLRVT